MRWTKLDTLFLGCTDLVVAVYNKPLIGLFKNRSLDNILNNRLRNFKERTLRYRFTMQHVPGLKNRAPDALSRHLTGDPQTSTAPPFRRYIIRFRQRFTPFTTLNHMGRTTRSNHQWQWHEDPSWHHRSWFSRKSQWMGFRYPLSIRQVPLHMRHAPPPPPPRTPT